MKESRKQGEKDRKNEGDTKRDQIKEGKKDRAN